MRRHPLRTSTFIFALAAVAAAANARGGELPALSSSATGGAFATQADGDALVSGAGQPPGLANDPAAPPAGGGMPTIGDAGTYSWGVDWTKIPPVRPVARSGEFMMTPTTPGYFSLLDQLRGNYRQTPPFLPYSFQGDTTAPSFDVDFRYLDDPNNTQFDFWDPWKRMHVNDDWMLSLGGNVRMRTMDEMGSRLGTVNNDYTLFRSRLHGDLWYQDKVRVFIEGEYADSYDYDLPPGARDINRGDFLNLFMDLKLFETEDGEAYFRGGRQEITYGSRRLLGAKILEQFASQLGRRQGLLHGTGVERRRLLDRAGDHQSQQLRCAGRAPEPVRSVAHPHLPAGHEHRPLLFGLRRHGPRRGDGQRRRQGTFNVHTLGVRTSGDKDHWLWDLESMLQLGSWANQDKLAGALSVAGGYWFSNLPTQPQLWLSYDWASGTPNPGQGSTNATFFQMSPAVHTYFGATDLIGRQNIQDRARTGPVLSRELGHRDLPVPSLRPRQRPRWALQHFRNRLAQQSHRRRGRDVGNEIDLSLDMHLATHSNLTVGWSKLFAGTFIAQTGPNVSPELWYIQYNYRW